jgi:hypothetical protein
MKINFQTVLTLPKQRKKAFVAACSMFVFSLFFLMPLDVYLNNFIYFNISLRVVVLPLFVVSAGLFLVIILVVPLIFRGRALDVVTLLLCGAVLAFYVQALFLNSEAWQLIGSRQDYSEISFARSIEWMIFFISFFLPLCIWKGFRGSKKYKNIKWENGILYILIVILGMQLTGVVTALLNYNNPVNEPRFLSYDKIFRLSASKNICVFIIDNLDVKYMNDVLKEFPELYEQLDGFTFYENNTSTYTNTFPTLTHMLTGERYNGHDSQLDYWDKAWARRNIIDILRENGYNSTLFVFNNFIYGNLNHLYARADNFATQQEVAMKIKYPQIAKATLSISFSRIFPSNFKTIFPVRSIVDFSNDFYELADNILPPAMNAKTDLFFYNNLKTTGLYTQDEYKTFTFIHLASVHWLSKGYRYNPNMHTVELYEDAGVIEVARGTFAILSEYFKQMKNLGIYDSSIIIVVADHGRRPTFDKPISPDLLQLQGEITSTLLIKPKNTRGRLKRDPIPELSHVNFGASVLQAAGLPHEDFGLSYFDIINGNLPQKRELSLLLLKGAPTDVPPGKYEITGDANDFSNWFFVP